MATNGGSLFKVNYNEEARTLILFTPERNSSASNIDFKEASFTQCATHGNVTDCVNKTKDVKTDALAELINIENKGRYTIVTDSNKTMYGDYKTPEQKVVEKYVNVETSGGKLASMNDSLSYAGYSR